MIMEHYKNIEEYFDLKKEDIIIILKEQLIPILAKQIHRYMKVGMMKNEITAKKVTEEIEGGNRDLDKETTTQKYETEKNKRKGTDEDEEQDSENEEKEEESEQEKTYDEIYQKNR